MVDDHTCSLPTRNPQLPAPTTSLQYSLDSLDPINMNGENLYVFWGYAFVKDHPDVENHVLKVILHSVKEDLVFQTEVLPRPDITEAFPEYNQELDRTGFKVLLSRHALRVDNYQVGILIENSQGRPLYYQLTGDYIERNNNVLRFIRAH